MANGQKLPYWATALALFFMTADGLHLLINPEDALPNLPALTLAAVIDLALTGGLVAFRQRRSIGGLLIALIFMFASGSLSTVYWFRQIRGEAKTEEVFNTQQQAALKPLIALRDRIVDADKGLSSLAKHSADMAAREVSDGDSCEVKKAIPGPRQRFRLFDSEFFAALERAFSGLSERVDAEIKVVRKLQAVTGAPLQQGLERLNHALDNATSIVSDPAFSKVVDALRKRVDNDGIAHVDGTVTFRCPDPSVVGEAQTVIARLSSLPALPTRIVVPDYTKANDALRIPVAVLHGSWDQFSPPDVVALLISVLLEFALFALSSAFARRPKRTHRFAELDEAFDMEPETVMASVKVLLDPADPRVRRIVEILARYTIRFGMWEFVMVAHNCPDARATELASAIRILEAHHGLARRSWMAPRTFLWIWSYLFRKETRGCDRREYFTIDRDLLSEIHVADFIVRKNVRQRYARPATVVSFSPAAE